MRSPDRRDHWSRGRYLEIVAPERLVFQADVIVDDLLRFAAHTTVIFEDADSGATRLTVRQSYQVLDPNFASAIEGAAEGWRTTLDRLEQEVARIRAERSVLHGHFRLERVYPVPPPRVFQALSDPAAKAVWFVGGEGYETLQRSMDFRVGGREVLRGRWSSGTVSAFDAVYLDIVPNERVIYSYQMSLDETKISVSLATIQLFAQGTETRLALDEHGAFLDGYDDGGSRKRGTGLLLDRLGASLA